MRTGLVVVGAAIAVIGGGLFLSLFVISGGPASTTHVSFDNPQLPGRSSWPEVIAKSTSTTASIGLTWTATAPVNVSLTPAGACDSPLGVCPTGPSLFNWTLATSGKQTGSTGNASAFILDVTNPATGFVGFNAVVALETTPSSALPVWAWGLIALGAVILLAIGGIALFLGLFLPGGVYREPPSDDVKRTRPPPPRGPDSGPPGG